MNTERFDGHTPGPWILSTEGSATGDAVRWISAGIDEPCVCTDLLGATDADAHLIAAAPDLLAALIEEREENERLTEKVRMLNSRCMHLEGLLEEWTEASE